MRSAAFLVLALLGVRAAGAPPLVLELPSGNEPLRVRLELIGEPSPDSAWETFIDRLFDYFDRDGDSRLSPAETGRNFPLPLPAGKEAGIDFKKLDANGDGVADRAEWKAFCRAAGFGPVMVAVEPCPADVQRRSTALFRRLDADGDGSLSAEELRRAPGLLGQLDEDEDEAITPAELLATEPASPSAKPVPVKVRLVWDADPAKASAALPLATKGDGKPTVTALGQGWVVTTGRQEAPRSPRDAAEFCRSQFRSTAGNKPSVDRKALAGDPAAALLLAMFDSADRDGDGQLSGAELDAYLKLVEQGAACQIRVTAAQRGADLFGLLDTDGDGKLTYRELRDAARVLRGGRRADMPRLVELRVGQGAVGPSFGHLPLTSTAKRAPAPTPSAAKGPRWFMALDRNGDGMLSPGEFLGPPEIFQKLDRNGDGVIDAAEATAASSIPGK